MYLPVICFIFLITSILLSARLYLLRSQNKALHIDKKNLEDTLNENNQEFSKTKGVLESSEKQMGGLQEELKNVREQLTRAQTAATKESTEKNSLEDLLKKYNETINQAKQDLNNHFKITATSILEEKTKSFSEKSKKEVQDLLAPLKSNIDSFQKTVNETLKENASDQRALKELIDPLDSRISQFTRALKGDFKVQGDFGETVLERLFEFIGFKKGVHYTEQGRDMKLITDEGKRAKPDFIVHLPEDRKIIFDSKVSIKHAIEYFNSDDPDEKKYLISQHTSSIKEHIKELSDKNYQSVFKEESLDFVVMFVPHDSALITALNQDPSLQSFAIQKKVWLTSPTLVMPFLHIIKDFWRKNTMNKNVMEISRFAGLMYDQLDSALKKFQNIKNKLDQAAKSYDDANRTLFDGQRSVITYAQKVKELGAKTSKNISFEPEEMAISTEAIDDSTEEEKGFLKETPELDEVQF
ncbi:MAG: DNA recombination protein RmuC [Chlamydiae bacterium]|nr:DNA recombination protein RmuC [Chlamydiota bacterium]